MPSSSHVSRRAQAGAAPLLLPAAPGRPGYRVGGIHILLVFQGCEGEPGQAGEVDELIPVPGAGGDELGLGRRLGLGPAAEVRRVLPRLHSDNLEQLAARLQVGEAGHQGVVADDHPVPILVVESVHRLHGLGDGEHHGRVKGQGTALAPGPQGCHVHRERQGVEGVGHGGEKVVMGPAGPGLLVNDGHRYPPVPTGNRLSRENSPPRESAWWQRH